MYNMHNLVSILYIFFYLLVKDPWKSGPLGLQMISLIT